MPLVGVFLIKFSHYLSKKKNSNGGWYFFIYVPPRVIIFDAHVCIHWSPLFHVIYLFIGQAMIHFAVSDEALQKMPI